MRQGKNFSGNLGKIDSNLQRDFTSKHAMHANCEENVRYAGEFHVDKKGDKYILVVDNNSGTYSPARDDLPTIAALFEKNFPGLEV